MIPHGHPDQFRSVVWTDLSVRLDASGALAADLQAGAPPTDPVRRMGPLVAALGDVTERWGAVGPSHPEGLRPFVRDVLLPLWCDLPQVEQEAAARWLIRLSCCQKVGTGARARRLSLSLSDLLAVAVADGSLPFSPTCRAFLEALRDQVTEWRASSHPKDAYPWWTQAAEVGARYALWSNAAAGLFSHLTAGLPQQDAALLRSLMETADQAGGAKDDVLCQPPRAAHPWTDVRAALDRILIAPSQTDTAPERAGAVRKM